MFKKLNYFGILKLLLIVTIVAVFGTTFFASNSSAASNCELVKSTQSFGYPSHASVGYFCQGSTPSENRWCWYENDGKGTFPPKGSASDDSCPSFTDINGKCGKAATNWNVRMSSWPSSSGSAFFCAKGNPSNWAVAFPPVGKTVSWTCRGLNGGGDTSCKASHTWGNGHEGGDQPLKPQCSVYPLVIKRGLGLGCNVDF